MNRDKLIFHISNDKGQVDVYQRQEEICCLKNEYAEDNWHDSVKFWNGVLYVPKDEIIATSTKINIKTYMGDFDGEIFIWKLEKGKAFFEGSGGLKYQGKAVC